MSERTAMSEGPPGDLARATLGMTAITAVSRVTGLVRVLVVAAVLGPTFLGNVYQSANTVPNVVFELFVAGALQAALIPTLVGVLDGDEREAEHVAGSVLGLAVAVLSAVAVIGMVAAPWIMRVLVSGVDDPTIRERQIDLGVVFLWIFLPQVLLYAAGLVATAVLNARERFFLPVAAPILNNIVVVAAYVIFDSMGGPESGLDLDAVEIAVLAGGTTLAVAVFTMVPVAAVVARGFSLRPRLDHRHPAVRRILRHGMWAAAWLAGTQVLLATVLVLANSVEGGVIVWQVALTFFLLPHALFGLPVITALFPRLSRAAAGSDRAAAARLTAQGLRTLSLLTVPAAVALGVLGGGAAEVVLVGEGAGAADAVGRTVAAFAAGLPGYAAFLFLTRAFYAAGDARTPAVVAWVLAVGGSTAMVVGSLVVDDADLVTALAAAHSLAYLGAAVALAVLVSRQVFGAEALAGVTGAIGRHVGLAGAAGAAMVAVTTLGPEIGGRAGVALVDVLLPGAVGAAVLLGADAVTGGRVRQTLVTAWGGGRG